MKLRALVCVCVCVCVREPQTQASQGKEGITGNVCTNCCLYCIVYLSRRNANRSHLRCVLTLDSSLRQCTYLRSRAEDGLYTHLLSYGYVTIHWVLVCVKHDTVANALNSCFWKYVIFDMLKIGPRCGDQLSWIKEVWNNATIRHKYIVIPVNEILFCTCIHFCDMFWPFMMVIFKSFTCEYKKHAGAFDIYRTQNLKKYIKLYKYNSMYPAKNCNLISFSVGLL